MVGGRDTILYEKIDEMEQLLNEYNDRVYQSKVLGQEDEEINLLTKCLEHLYPYERELLTELCINKVSERDCAKLTGLTRYRVRKEKERLLTLTAGVFKKSSVQHNF